MRATWLAAAGPLLLLLNVGCATTVELRMGSPAAARAALEQINSNLTALERPLNVKEGTVSVRLRDAEGKLHRSTGHPARLLFQRPQCLYFDIRSLLGPTVAHIGSNDEHYWLWIDIDDRNRKLWWGTWLALELGRARTAAVPPDQLLDALLLRPLPTRLPGGIAPVLIEEWHGVGQAARRARRVLFFLRADEQGWPYVARTVELGEAADGLPSEMVVYDPSGAIVMRARYDNYQHVADTPDAPLTPRRYRLEWPQEGTALDLNVAVMAYFDRDVPCDFFPDEWTAAEERLDLESMTPAQ